MPTDDVTAVHTASLSSAALSNASMFDVLLVEDSPSDVLLMQLAVEDFLPTLTLHVVPDGVSALAFLNRQPPYERAPGRGWCCSTAVPSV
ncbi:hypothetical protein ACFSC4_22860 [Deinococcus malanensis]|uniref:hypothetical protein n=1 Tax=Deinococcus malanensis TaxID=1706855 RepID=UPI0036314D75